MSAIELQNVPEEALKALKMLEDKGFSAYLVGGCVRDLITGRKPKDWDITTDATPENIIAAFPHTHYENSFGTVGVVFDETRDETTRVIEITPFRVESDYTDGRHPKKVTFAKTLGEDLSRRDFTINALALEIETTKGQHKGHITDLYGGIHDLHKQIIRTVGNPDARFTEDGLRILRAVRITTELDFSLDGPTELSIVKNASILRSISSERIRDEFIKIIMSDRPGNGLLLLRKLSLLEYVIPELEQSFGIEQNQAHAFDVWEHLVRTLDHAAKKKASLEVRLAALLHDIGKPATRRKGENGDWTFYGHEVVGAKMAKNILNRLKFPMKQIDTVYKLVRWHMFFSDTEKITLSAVRRIITKVGKENIWSLIDVRTCDRIGTGRPKENPYRLRKYQSMIEEALRDPISVGMLKVNGTELMKELNIPPGPAIGNILHALLEEVLEYPQKNTREGLIARSRELISLPETELSNLGSEGKKKKEKEEEEAIEELRSKYHVE